MAPDIKPLQTSVDDLPKCPHCQGVIWDKMHLYNNSSDPMDLGTLRVCTCTPLEQVTRYVKSIFPETQLFDSEMWNRYIRHHFDDNFLPLREDTEILVKSNAISYILGYLSGEGLDVKEITKIHEYLIENYY